MARILVIDDEPLVGLMIQRTLEPPHAVTVQRSARAALALFEQGERYEAILTDLHMPDGDGLWLREQLARIDASLPARMLFLTGAAHEMKDRRDVHILEKPFRSAELIGRIDDLLNGRAARR